MKKYSLLLILSFFYTFSFGQKVVFSDKPDEFIKQVSKYLKGSQKEYIRETGENFNAFWESTLNASQQKKITDLGGLMMKKRYTYTYFHLFYQSIMSGVETESFNLDEFLDVADKMLKNEKNIPIQNFFKTSNLFLCDSSIAKTNFNSIVPENGSFKFEYIAPVEEKTEVDNLLEKAKELEEQNKKVDDTFDEWNEEDDDSWEATDEGDWEDDWGDEEEEEIEQKPEENVDERKISAVGYQKPVQPKISGGVITFTDVDFKFITKYDTALLEKTTGSYMFSNKLFVAKGGKMDWRTAGIEEGACYVDLGEWHMNMKGTKFRAEDVKLTYPEAVNGQVEGIFEFQSQRIANRNLASYPRFLSYHSVSEYKNLGDNIYLSGGFSMEGRKINTSSVDGEIGKLIVKYDGKERFRAKGKRFDIIDTILTSKSVGIIIFMNSDSIIHPSMSLKYGITDNRLTLSKGNRSTYTPFRDTYHKVEIQAEKLDWYLNDKFINFSIASAPTHIPIKVESNHYYDDMKYLRLRGVGTFHPLQSLVYYAKKKKTNVVYVNDVAKYFKKRPATYAGAMTSLANKGFVTFDRRSGKITLRDKAYFYVKARRKKTDYDNISIKSLAGSNNGQINLEDNTLKLHGVERFYISDSLTVYNEPRDGVVIIKKNRNMNLHGRLVAGKYYFICDSMDFNYDRFEIQLNKIDSIQFSFKVKQKEEDIGKKPEEEKELGLAVDYASGMLYIDKPNNKSSRRKNPGYPFFDAVTGAQVHFSDDNVLGGVYGEDVYFHIPPFDIDSLNSVDPNKANFKGTFYSGGIFPKFEEVLTVREDKDLSFGFVHTVPEEGYKIYEKDGTVFKGSIDMSDFGMHGHGKIEHITSTLYSDDFIYYPDSITTEKGSKVEMLQGNHKKTTFPNMKAEDYQMRWLVEEDSLHLYNNDSTKPFDIYQGKAYLDGRLTIRENGLFGQGKVQTNHAYAFSNNFNFQDEYFTGRYAEFNVASEEEGKPALLTHDAKLRFDMIKEEVNFGPEEEGYASTEFPFMQYKTSLGEGLLKIKEDVVIMKMEEGGDIEDSYFYSTHPDQDSLVYNATSAICDLKAYKLDISGVPFIKVADSKVVPDSGEVHIFENAEFQTLKNAGLIIDTLEEYHTLHSGEIDVFSRTKIFEGEAKYSYVNTVNDTFDILFSDYKMLPYTARKRETREYTISFADIEEDDNFFISPRMQYRGSAKLSAQNEFLSFDGFVKLDLNSSDISDYFVFKSENVDPQHVEVDMTNPTDLDGTPLVTGIFVDETINEVYTSVVALKENEEDLEVFNVKGALSFDPETNEFTLGDTAKLGGKTRVGNIIQYNDSSTHVSYSGKFNFHTNTKDFQIFSAGEGDGIVKDKKYHFNTFTTLQYRLPGTLLRNIADSCFNHTRDEYAAISSLEDIEVPMAELSSNRAVDGIMEEYQMSGELKPLFEYSSKFGKTFTFSNIKFNWEVNENSWWCEDTVGVSNIGKKNIDALMHAKLEIHKNSENDEINMLIFPDSTVWYYLSYRDNILYMISSDYEFNKYVHKKTIPLEERKEKEFMISITDFIEKEEFVQKYKTQFYKIKGDSVNFDSLDMVYSQMIASFTEEKSDGKDEEVEELDSDDGFEELDSEEDIETPEEDNTDEKEEDNVKEEEDDLDFEEDELNEEDFEESSVTNVKPPKKKKKKKEKKPKEEEKDTTEESDDEEDFEDLEFDEED